MWIQCGNGPEGQATAGLASKALPLPCWPLARNWSRQPPTENAPYGQISAPATNRQTQPPRLAPPFRPFPSPSTTTSSPYPCAPASTQTVRATHNADNIFHAQQPPSQLAGRDPSPTPVSGKCKPGHWPTGVSSTWPSCRGDRVASWQCHGKRTSQKRGAIRRSALGKHATHNWAEKSHQPRPPLASEMTW